MIKHPIKIEEIEDDCDYSKALLLASNAGEDRIYEQNFVCTDVSRNTFYYLGKNKVWDKDKEAALHKLFNSLAPTVMKFYNELVRELDDVMESPILDVPKSERFQERNKNFRPFYKGMIDKKGKYRNKLYKKVKKEIKNYAAA